MHRYQADNEPHNNGQHQIDDAQLQQRLCSPLYGSLIQAVELISDAVQAEIGAGRIDGTPAGTPTCYVGTMGLRVPAVVRSAMQEWPLCESSIFELIRQRANEQTIVRPCNLLNDSIQHRREAYMPLTSICRVIDSLGLNVKPEPQLTCSLIFLRCDVDRAFRETEVERLRQLEPLVARVLRRGYQQEFETTGGPWPDTADLLTRRMYASPRKRLDSLSETERKVLSYLQTPMTERRIARQLQRSPHTIHVHVKSIYRKLGVSSRKELNMLIGQVEQIESGEVPA